MNVYINKTLCLCNILFVRQSMQLNNTCHEKRRKKVSCLNETNVVFFLHFIHFQQQADVHNFIHVCGWISYVSIFYFRKRNSLPPCLREYFYLYALCLPFKLEKRWKVQLFLSIIEDIIYSKAGSYFYLIYGTSIIFKL